MRAQRKLGPLSQWNCGKLGPLFYPCTNETPFLPLVLLPLSYPWYCNPLTTTASVGTSSPPGNPSYPLHEISSSSSPRTAVLARGMLEHWLGYSYRRLPFSFGLILSFSLLPARRYAHFVLTLCSADCRLGREVTTCPTLSALLITDSQKP